MALRIVDFKSLTAAQRAEAAAILRDALAHMPFAYQEPGEAEAEIARVMDDADWFGFAALDGEAVCGWIGCAREYSHAWELHPLVVAPTNQRQGIGGKLMAALEAEAGFQGALTLYLGADDGAGGTSLSGAELFPDVLGKATNIAVTGNHPFTFYRRHGYEVVGLIPDANGAGKPDIMMAKRVQVAP